MNDVQWTTKENLDKKEIQSKLMHNRPVNQAIGLPATRPMGQNA